MTVVLAALTILVNSHVMPHPDPYPIPDCKHGRKVIHHLQEETNYMNEIMGLPLSPIRGSLYPCKTIGWRRTLWGSRYKDARIKYYNPPNLSSWLCIHRYEGSWTDPNAPYYGGLQMDYEFMSTYGSRLLREKGTADHWTWLEQIWTSVKAWRTRGYNPWPTTARLCGLL